uniref:cellulose 1,4-beta-cellobiosidase (non-reducing end) n=1 Tax=Reticulitermes flavipes gut symbiont cell-2 TaxID=332194 RepID=Q462H0_9EUKA|nr:endoglucanase-type cellulase [Reticulitermes flavipes gut symbiont cell-2]
MLTVLFLLSLGWCEKHPAFQWKKDGVTQNGFLVHDRHVGDNWYRDQKDGKSGALDLDYENDVGVTVSGGTLTQRLVSNYSWNNKTVVGSRLYIMTADEKKYEKFNLTGKEFTFTVNLAQIPCGVNAALYTVEMPADGIDATDQTQGAPYGYGYCDANCVDGGCCPEFDGIEATSKALVFTTHTCSGTGSGRGGYTGCDTSGCGYNPYRDDNNHSFWTSSVNLAQPVTIVTQFQTNGDVTRKYIQNGNPIDGGTLNQSRCSGKQNMTSTFSRGHVVVFSLWDSDGMSWLDGGNAGPCTSYNIKDVETRTPNLTVTWSDVKFGNIGSTTN